MPAGTLNLVDELTIEKGARYLLDLKIRENACDVWTVQVTGVGGVGDTVSITVFDSATGDLDQFETTVTHTVGAGETADDVAVALAALLNALSFTQQTPDPNGTGCLAEALSLLSATSSGDTVTITGGRRADFLAVVEATTGAATAVATNTDSVLIDITGDVFTSMVRKSEADATPLADWSSAFTISDGPLGHLQFLLGAATTAAYTWEAGFWDLFRDEGGGLISKILMGRVQVMPRMTQ